MPRKPVQQYSVYNHDGSLVVCDVPLSLARSEASRLNAEARVVIEHRPAHVVNGVVMFPAHTKYAGMTGGEVSRYEVRTADGLVIQ